MPLPSPSFQVRFLILTLIGLLAIIGTLINIWLVPLSRECRTHADSPWDWTDPLEATTGLVSRAIHPVEQALFGEAGILVGLELTGSAGSLDQVISDALNDLDRAEKLGAPGSVVPVCRRYFQELRSRSEALVRTSSHHDSLVEQILQARAGCLAELDRTGEELLSSELARYPDPDDPSHVARLIYLEGDRIMDKLQSPIPGRGISNADCDRLEEPIRTLESIVSGDSRQDRHLRSLAAAGEEMVLRCRDLVIPGMAQGLLPDISPLFLAYEDLVQMRTELRRREIRRAR